MKKIQTNNEGIKYANILFKGKIYQNLGDNLQLLAIDNLYSIMGIRKENIVYIPYENLADFISENGEKVILPINFPFLEYKKNGIAGTFSEDIIPVFLGFNIVDFNLSELEINYLKNFEPIGCRDEYTFRIVKNLGINAWLNGCMTLTMFNSNIEDKYLKKTLFVDIDKEVIDQIPNKIKKDYITYSQIVIGESDINEIIKERYAQYKKLAKIVITSRLHCALPAVAMGIPTILIVDKISQRFSWIEKIIPIYKKNEINKINWDIRESEVSSIRSYMIRNAIDFIDCAKKRKKVNNCTKDMIYINNYFMKRKKNQYNVDGFTNTILYIKENWKKNKPIAYGIWGLTYVAEMLYRYIETYYPSASLVGVYDKSKKGKFKGISIAAIESENEEKLLSTEIFVTAWAATEDAEKLFYSINKMNGVCLCYKK